MAIKLNPYGAAEFAGAVAKVGKSKSPKSLVDRMPSSDLAAKVGGRDISSEEMTRRVVRLTAQN